MFKVNDLIMYGGTGVCKVTAITTNEFDGQDKLYYILEPVYQAGIIYAPVDNKKVFMRPVMSESEANDVIDRMPGVSSEVFKSSSTQQLSKHYQSVIDRHNTDDLIMLTKSIRRKMNDAISQNRHLGQIDKRFMKRAEDLLFGELAAALCIPREDVVGYIENRLGTHH